ERGRPLSEVRYLLGATKGGLSGGTISSMLMLIDEVGKNRALRRLLADPYALSPDRAHDLNLDVGDFHGVRRDPTLGLWTGPFVMAAVNTRVVRRSNALLGHTYGRHFRYSEVQSFPRGLRGLVYALLLSGGLGGFVSLAKIPATRRLLARVLPNPGEGP